MAALGSKVVEARLTHPTKTGYRGKLERTLSLEVLVRLEGQFEPAIEAVPLGKRRAVLRSELGLEADE